MNGYALPGSSSTSGFQTGGITPAQIAALGSVKPLSVGDLSGQPSINAISQGALNPLGDTNLVGQDLGVDIGKLSGLGESGGGLFDGMSLGEGLNYGLTGLQAISSLWAAFNANKMAKKQFNFNKEVTTANMDNSIQSYNTALADRARARAVTENRDQASADAYVEENRLRDFGG